MQRTIQLVFQSYYTCCHGIDSPACIRSCHEMISVEGGRAAREERRAMYVCATPRTYLGYVRRRKPPTRRPSIPEIGCCPACMQARGQHIVASFATAQRTEKPTERTEATYVHTKSVAELSLTTIESVSIRTKCPAKHDPTASREYATESIRGHQYSTSAMSRGRKKVQFVLSIWGERVSKH